MLDELTAFQRDLLHVTAGLSEPKGLDIKAELERDYNSEINHGRLYPNLDTLVEMNLIQKEKQDERTNRYSLTKYGNRALELRRKWINRHWSQKKDREERSTPYAGD